MAPRRNCFLVYTPDDDGKWSPYRVDDDAGLEAAMAQVEANMTWPAAVEIRPIWFHLVIAQV